jgi:lambda repressor-like predicted transcriptional regulator
MADCKEAWARPIAKMYTDGDSITDIMKKTGLTANTIKTYLSFMKIPRDEKIYHIGTEPADEWSRKWEEITQILRAAGYRK